VDGDSATVAELICLLSAIANIPLRQDIAVTGSVNQRGEIQPIGAVNEKVEGLFDVCCEMGLNGAQGVNLSVQRTPIFRTKVALSWQLAQQRT
jgi:predicted ATP-dependent protease